MAVNQDRAQWGPALSVFTCSYLRFPGAGVVVQEHVDDDLSIGSRRVPQRLTLFGIRVGWRVALMENAERGSSTMRTTWRTDWMPEPFGVDPDVSLPAA